MMKRLKFFLIMTIAVVMMTAPSVSAAAISSIQDAEESMEAYVEEGILLYDSEEAPSQEEPSETPSEEPSEEPIKVTPHWEENKTMYMLEDGSYATGSKKISGVYYIFKSTGKLATSKKGSIVKVGSNYYMADKNGKALKYWQVFKDKLYYGASNGKCKKSTSYLGFAFDSKAAATKTTTARVKAKIEAVKVYRSITNTSMKKSERLKACWNYMVDTKRFSYVSKYPNLNKKTTWFYTTAYDMLTTKKGNCYSFACAFAALANECGYDPYVVCGRVSGNRDHKSDGMTRHSWVLINNYNYDPEGHFAGWYLNCYKSKTYTRKHTIQQTVQYESKR